MHKAYDGCRRDAQEQTGSGRAGAARREGALNTHPLPRHSGTRGQPCRREFRKVPLAGEAWSCVTAAAISSNHQDDGWREKSGSVVMSLRLLKQLWIMYTNYTHVNTHSHLGQGTASPANLPHCTAYQDLHFSL